MSDSYTKGAINRGYQLFNLIKSIFRSVIVFLDVIVNQVELIPAQTQTQERLSNKSRKVREFGYECICSSTPK